MTHKKDNCIRISEVLKKEKEEISNRPQKASSLNQPKTLRNQKSKNVGLALSGGGIRSASFATGVIQAFLNQKNNPKVGSFEKVFKYLSTVSGGGYLGGTLTWLKKNGCSLEEELENENGVRNRKNGKIWLDYVRQHGNYLKPKSISSLSLLSVVLRNMFTSLLLYFSILVLFFCFFNAFDLLIFQDNNRTTEYFNLEKIYTIPSLFLVSLMLYISVVLIYPVATFIGSFSPFALKKGEINIIRSQAFLGAIWFFGISLITFKFINSLDFNLFLLLTNNQKIDAYTLISIGLIFISLLSFIALFITLTNPSANTISANNYKARLFGQQNAGLILGITLTLGIISSLPFLFEQANNHLHSPELISSIAGAFGLIGSFFQFNKGRSKEVDRGVNTNLIIIVSSILLILSMLLGAYTVVYYFYEDSLNDKVFYLAGFVLFISIFINLNYFGIGRMYRDRLMETFLPNKAAIESGNWAIANEADKKAITEYKDIRPYHIINTNVVLVDSKEDRFRGRGGDNFIISPLYCGSEATGYLHAKYWFNGRMNLPTAISISGAAVNPNSGVSGKGVTKNRMVSFILALLQIRLGYWAPNPQKSNKIFSRSINFFLTSLLRANFLVPGIRQGLFGRGLHSKAFWLELTDGGHFDNTGVYELIRRELDVIVMSLSSADPGYKFEDLANLIQKSRVDFGAIIEFNKQEFNNLIPDIKTGSSQASYAIAKITYAKKDSITGENLTGKLVLISATKHHSISPEISSYIKSNPDFPHQSTSDQFYDEQQFEVYRELGFLSATEFLNGKEVKSGLFI